VTDLTRPDPVPGTAEGLKAFVVTPFGRLARAHVAGTMADAMVAAAFAGSLFFSLPADDARVPVLRYLAITMLPFAALSPLIGPLIDRLKGGHRYVVIGSAVLRALLCYLLIDEIAGAGTEFFLLALCLLVCQKAYQVARSALVPTVVRSDRELVEANSKLSLLSGLSSFIGVVPAAILLKLFGPEWAIGLAMCTYVVTAVMAARILPAKVASAPADATERHELRGAGILMAGSAMGLLRGCVGFLTLLVAFDFRGGGRAPWEFAVVGAASVFCQLLGAAAAPRIRDHTSEENLLTGALALVVVGGFVSLLLGDVSGAAILGASVAFAAASGKLAFDSILQRDAPDANRGRAFARFETRFQVSWVIGGLLPVAFDIHAGLGFVMILVVSLVALGSYAIGRLAWAHRTGARQTAATAAALGIEERFSEVSGEVREKLTGAPRAAYRRIRHLPPADGGGSGDDGRNGPVELDEDPDLWPEPEWAEEPPTARLDEPTPSGDDGRRRRWRPGRRARSVQVVEPEESSTYPWEPPDDDDDGPGAFLADVDPSVSNPYPWAPDDEATRRLP